MNKQQLLENFEQYFQVDDANQVNLKEVSHDEVPATVSELEEKIPALFKLANEMKELDHKMLSPLRSLGDIATDLATFLQAQSRKIDLIMSHILATEQPDEDNIYCDSYGGGGIRFTSSTTYPLGTQLRTKLFLRQEAAAIYCYCEVIDVKSGEDNTFQHTIAFTKIRDEDQELVVRASLHAQTRQLKKRQSDQNKEQNS
ncbi:PilZ domain-containing protein [Pseudoalteromonas byunsanensis]|uniref:PilZ domain-containing protein n=1 Tax=Pseudoalteromonas byunsanensis TaxID=327939 RepID=A0A1S1NCV9_9GAMM|nr:PilZ domain-containing protein [Pseudoalteromonas byunsanensis]OHU97305.1 PilZ domain-containing protein [Pseudoalteromonas byunsanensis]